jgi:hypothetical protein
MTFIPEYYRKYYYKQETLTPLLGGSISKTEMAEKMKNNLEAIYHSSKMLKNLQFKDTASLYDVLTYNDVKLNRFFRYQNKEDIEMMNLGEDLDEHRHEAQYSDNENSKWIVNPRDQVHRKISFNGLKEKNIGLVLLVSNLPKEILKYDALIENFFDYIIKIIFDTVTYCFKKGTDEKINISPEFEWYIMYQGIPNSQEYGHEVFIVFEDAMMMYLFLQLMDDLEVKNDQSLKILNDIKINEIIIPKIKELFDVDVSNLLKRQNDIIVHLKELMSIGTQINEEERPPDDYLTTIKKLSESYTIDPKDLSDVPADMLDQVKQYIIDFRIHVLTDLEKKQKERTIRDQEETSKLWSETKTYEDNSMNNLSDVEFERLMQNREKSLSEKNYYLKLGQYKRREEVRLKNYYNFMNFTKHQSYITKVVPQNRKKFLANFVHNVNNENNKIDSNFSYYTKHANYVKYREKVKEIEEKNDGEDVKEEIEASKINYLEHVNQIAEENAQEGGINHIDNAMDVDVPNDIHESELPEKKEELLTEKTANLDSIGMVMEKYIDSKIDDVQKLEFIHDYIFSNKDTQIDKRARPYKVFKQGIFELTGKSETKILNSIIDDLFKLYK